MSIKIILFMICIASATRGAMASEPHQLRGRNVACSDNSKMQLWDISANSPLIRGEMLKKDYCWKTMEGLRVDMVQKIGGFSRVRNLAGGAEYLVYGADLGKVVERPERKSVSVNSLTLVSIENALEQHGGVSSSKPVPVVKLRIREFGVRSQIYTSTAISNGQ